MKYPFCAEEIADGAKKCKHWFQKEFAYRIEFFMGILNGLIFIFTSLWSGRKKTGNTEGLTGHWLIGSGH